MWWFLGTFLGCGDPSGEEPEAARPAPEARLEGVTSVEAPAGPPVSLTSSDGTGLRLVSLEARSVVEDPLAFTELRLVFDNPEDRVVEGRFAITLPSGAAVSRFAMKIGDAWQEGEVLERKQAERVYEDFLHRRQDPALLEKEAGNQFRARVFPIPAKGRKELVISYSHELSDRQPWRLPLRGLPQLDALDVSVAVDGFGGSAERFEDHRKSVVPDQDLVLVVETGPAVGVRNGDLVAVRIEPRLDLSQEPVDGLTVLLDTSASRALGFRGQVDRVGEVLASMGDIPARVVLFDQEVVEIWAGTASGFDEAARRSIVERGALGASDLGAALAWVAAHPAHGRVLVVSDGVATAGETDPQALREAAKSLEAGGVTRLDALVDGGLRDAALLAEITTALPRAGVVLDASTPPDTVAMRLRGGTASGVEVHVPGAAWVWPDTLNGLQSGDDVLVYASLPAGQPLVVELDGDPVGPIALAAVERPLVERALAQAGIARLTHLQAITDDETRKKELVAEIVATSVKHRVLSDWTALLVLESEADYTRYGIDRAALTDVMAVGDDGYLRVLDRADFVVGAAGGEDVPGVDLGPRDPTADAPSEEEPASPPRSSAKPASDDGKSVMLQFLTTRGDASAEPQDLWSDQDIGLLGATGVGGDTAWHPGDTTPAASVAVGDGEIEPGDASVVKATVRRYANQLRYCYELRMREQPELAGRIEIEWVVAEGRVTSAEVFVNTTGDPELAACVARKVKLWEFPPEVSGEVLWPFIFKQPQRGVVSAPPPPPRITIPKAAAWTGPFAEVMEAIGAGEADDALIRARSWREEAPGDELALLALGEALEALDRDAEAARAYGSLIDLFPSRADIRRMAGERLERVGALALASDTYGRAVEQRRDHPSGHHLFAWALAREARWEEAFSALEAAPDMRWSTGFPGAERILTEDLGLIGAAWIGADPARKEEITRRLAAAGAVLEAEPSTRFVLVWETDANDVDFHIYDARGGHAWYSDKGLPSGGALYDDVTDGYGPECFAIPGALRAGPYTLQAHYYRRGPMGYGMGQLQVIRHDGKGGVTVESRPSSSWWTRPTWTSAPCASASRRCRTRRTWRHPART